MERYPVTEKDKELIKIGLQVLADNFDDGIYNHTVGCAVLCKNGRFMNRPYKQISAETLSSLPICAIMRLYRRTEIHKIV